MKKVIIILLILIIPLLVIASELDTIKEIGEEKEAYQDVNTGDLIYKNIVDEKIIGFEKVYLNESYIVETCVNNTQTSKLECLNKTETKQIESGEKGPAIYQYSSPKGIIYDKETYNFVGINGWVCGEYIVILSNKDGGTSVKYRPNEYKCDKNNYPILRSGESGYIKNLKTGQIIEKRADVEI